MGQSLALFLAGTWNNVATDTNVLRLSRLAQAADAPCRQTSYYGARVGTALLDRVRGGALGHGLRRDVLEAYDFIRQNWADGDAVYMFGFSRGTRRARSSTGFIAKCGLMRQGPRITAKALYARYQSDADAPIWELVYHADRRLLEPGDDGPHLTEDEKALVRASRRIPVRFVGVWKTVGALGIPFENCPELSRQTLRFHHTRLSTLFEHSYHALAIDEHREAFQPTLWTHFTPKNSDPPSVPRPSRQVKRRWFAGAHADVGVGCPGALPSIAQHWLAGKALRAGLAFGATPRIVPGAALGSISNSYKDFMFGLCRRAKGNRRYYRTIGSPRLEKEKGWIDTASETIDARVFDHVRADPGYRPPLLIDWASRREIALATLNGTAEAGGVAP